jgi:hypothetical protein
MYWVVCRHHHHRFDWTRLGTLAATVAALRVNLRDEICCMNRMEIRKPPLSDHCLAATSATIAYEIDPLTDILTELNQIVFICLLEQVEAF